MTVVLDTDGLDALVRSLTHRGYRVLGPVVQEGAIVYGEIESAAELPIGWTDRQDGGTYRLERRGDGAHFGYAVGPHSWKNVLLPARIRLWQATRGARGGWRGPEEEPEDETPTALFGVRPCELRAIAIQDRVLLGGTYADRDYAVRRRNVFVVAVNCGEPSGTCFCVSMGSGPRAGAGYDLTLTEILDGGHRFLVEAGSQAGEEVLRELPARPAEEIDLEASLAVTDAAARRMGRELDTTDIRDLLVSSLDHPRWDEVARRCLTCANCTTVCPTCFCTSVEDATDLSGDHAERWRAWDSCFSVDYSYMHGGAVRQTTRSRYRQWMTHKLATWHDQFDSSGCVGCGRCITWCPVGIDITEEVRAIRASEEERHANA